MDAEVLDHHRLDRLDCSGGRVQSASIAVLATGAELRVDPRIVVTAAGPWSGEVARAAGIELQLDLTRGAMLAFEGRLVRTIVQRLRMPDDNDGLVPRGKVCIAGTTGVPTTDPSDRRVEEWERRQMREELSRIVPGLATAKLVHAWSAVRPLYDPNGRRTGADARTLSRDFTVLDHAQRDGIEGILSAVGRKLSTFRLMAERMSDAVCAKLSVRAPCRTAQTRLDSV